jgi:uncharacterized protein YprB with RNaseH-like and TPR domain
LVGYNVLKFDVPFIDVRLRKNGLMEEMVWHLLHDQHYVDLYQLLGDYYARGHCVSAGNNSSCVWGYGCQTSERSVY